MRIVIVTGLRFTTSDIPLMVESAFRKQGHLVELFPNDEGLSPREVALIRARRRSSQKFLRIYSNRLWKYLLKLRPDHLLIFGSNVSVLPQTLRRIKQQLKISISLWEENLRFWLPFQAGSLKCYDHIFVMDSYAIPLLKGPAELHNVHFLLAGCDPEVHSPLNLTTQEQNNLGADLCFIGTGYPNRRNLFEQLVDYELKLWGEGWDESPALLSFFRNETVYGIKKSKIYNASKIVLNLQGPHIQINGVSNRIFEVAACGGVSISEYKPDLINCFEPDKEIILFKDADDLRAKVDYYLTHPDKLAAIGQAAHQRALAEHTYDHRVQVILQYIEKN